MNIIIICCICCMNICCILIMRSSSRAALLSSFSASVFILFSSNSKNLLSDACVCLSNCASTSDILLSASVLFLRIPEFEGVLVEAVNVAVLAGDIPLSLTVSSSCASPPSLLSSSFCPCGELPWSYLSSSSSTSSSSAVWCLPSSSCAGSES